MATRWINGTGKRRDECMQNWYCEHEDCGACINEERYQCAGCGGWFCRNCSTVFEATAHQVCRSCLTVWQKLHWLFVQTCCVFCGQTREDTARLDKEPVQF